VCVCPLSADLENLDGREYDDTVTAETIYYNKSWDFETKSLKYRFINFKFKLDEDFQKFQNELWIIAVYMHFYINNSFYETKKM